MDIKMRDLSLSIFDKENKKHIEFIKQLLNDQSIKKRFQGMLPNLMSNNNFFGKGFLIKDNNELIGYIDISLINEENSVYLRGAIKEDKRGLKYGEQMLSNVTDYIINNYQEVETIKLKIEKDNISSLKTAESCGYIWINEDYYGYENKNKKIRK